MDGFAAGHGSRLTREGPHHDTGDDSRAADTTEQPWPPPPHDPRERELALVADGWEVRVFGGRHFQYFVTRGFWHVQLWEPNARVSILTPSRLTRGFYEAYPIANWKAQAHDYDKLVDLIGGLIGGPSEGLGARPLPSKAQLRRIERAFVDDIVHATNPLVS